ncbi:MAG: anti-sigma factor family protein [Fibrobacterota bacterium]
MMVCNRWYTEGLLYCSGELSDAQQKRYMAHMQECKSCRDQLSWHTKIAAAARDLPEEEVPADLDQRIRLMIQETESTSKTGKTIPFMMFLRRSAAAVALLLAGMWLSFTFWAHTPEDGDSIAAADSTATQDSAGLQDNSVPFIKGESTGIRSVGVSDSTDK